MMVEEDKKLERAIEIVKSLSEGINPFTNETYEGNSIINDPRMVRCLYYIVEVLEKYKAGNVVKYVQRKDLPYKFPQELISRVVLPSDKIGVNVFSKAVNAVIDASICKNLTGSALNLQLKRMGILGEEEYAEGKRRTILNGESAKYGIESVLSEFEGKTYEKVVFNEIGKKYLLEHLQEIMDYAG